MATVDRVVDALCGDRPLRAVCLRVVAAIGLTFVLWTSGCVVLAIEPGR